MNVLIKKPGVGAPIILQSHMDMVCEKNLDSNHNFDTDPLRLRIDGDFISADGTTLGADNGAGMAITLDILNDDFKSVPVEALFTTEEESTMNGVSSLDPAWFSAKRMINLDSGNEHVFTAGCAGGFRFLFSLSVRKTKEDSSPYFKPSYFKIELRGLYGGHSGIEIDKGRANALIIMARILDELPFYVEIADAFGGLKVNAIPREADVVICAKVKLERLQKELAEIEANLKKEYALTDPELSIKCFESEESKEKDTVLINANEAFIALALMPNGVLKFNQHMPNLVETSSNVGVLRVVETDYYGFYIEISGASRSSSSSQLDFLRRRIELLALKLKARVEFSGGYPGWEYNPNSKLLAEASAIYEKRHGRAPKAVAVHAGLECGFMSEKIPGLDIISYCVEMYDYHTPKERMSVSSLESVTAFTKELLSSLN